MNSIGKELFKRISSLPSFLMISISITGCSAEFKENLNQDFQSSFNNESYISSCMDQYEWHFIKKEFIKKGISRIKFMNYCECTLEEIYKNGGVQLSTIMPGNVMRLSNYCFQREIITSE